MTLKEFLSTLTKEEKNRFATECKCSVGHLYNVSSGIRRCSAELAIMIEKRTYGRVPREVSAPHVEW